MSADHRPVSALPGSNPVEALRTEAVPILYTKEQTDRFWSKVDKSGGPLSCWPWLAGRHAFGHGSFWVNQKSIRAHVFAFQCENGEIAANSIVRHSCDNPPCCNPSHLMAGSHADNMADKVERGRQAKGEMNGNSKLTRRQVDEIRSRHKPRDKIHGTTAMAREFGVTHHVIIGIVNDRSWRA